jgi:hypothetical protein
MPRPIRFLEFHAMPDDPWYFGPPADEFILPEQCVIPPKRYDFFEEP